MSDQVGFLILSPGLFRHTDPVACSARNGQNPPLPPTWACPFLEKQGDKHTLSLLSLQLYPKRKKLSCSCPVSFFKRHPQGGMSAELARDQKPYADIYTNGLLSNGRNIRSR